MPNTTSRYLGYNGLGYLAANLPNISGTFQPDEARIFSTLTGCFYSSSASFTQGDFQAASSNTGKAKCYFSASKSSSIYTSTNENRPLTCRCNCIIKY